MMMQCRLPSTTDTPTACLRSVADASAGAGAVNGASAIDMLARGTLAVCAWPAGDASADPDASITAPVIAPARLIVPSARDTRYRL